MKISNFRFINYFILIVFFLNDLNALSQNNYITVDYGWGLTTVLKNKYYSDLKKNMFSFDRLDSNNLQFIQTRPDYEGRIISKKAIDKGKIKNTEYIKTFDKFDSLKIIYYNIKSDYREIIPKNFDFRVKINIHNDEYMLDSIYWGDGYKEYPPLNYGYSTGITYGYKIVYNNITYIILYLEYIGGNHSYFTIKPAVFCIVNNQVKLIKISSDVQSSSSPLCFNDFDKDGFIDYLYYNYNMGDTIIRFYKIDFN